LAKTFSAAGYTPIVINDSPSPGNDGVKGTVSSFGGVDYVCLYTSGSNKIVRGLARATRPIRVTEALRHLGVQRGQLSWVSVPSGLYTPALHFSIRAVLGARVVVDVVERHDQSQFVRGWRDPYYLRHKCSSWLAGRLANRLIVISNDLAESYSRSQRTLIIPPTVDVAEYRPHAAVSNSERLKLVYAGTPSGKDMIGVVLRATLALTDAERRRVKIVLAGATKEQLSASPDVGAALLDDVGDTLVALGTLPRERILELLATASFSFLMRPEGGYAAAGFPTKVPESMAAGCPVILNITSDLGSYLTDDVDCLVSPTNSVDDVTRTLRRALRLDPAQRVSMSAAARATAERRFDFRGWGDSLRRFLSS
jgi:glycosyltransferase involved in cell wall biosynthesis